MAQHIMLDLETLSTAADAGIIQIGAQAFDPEGDGLIGPGICLNVDPQAVMNAGMRVEWETLHWWMSQPEAFRTLAAPGEGLLLSAALEALARYVGANGGSYAKVWSNGAAFDVPILESSYRRCRLDIPWRYNNVLDVRTLKWLTPGVERVKPEVAHNALSDARAQALWVQNMYRRLNGAPAGEEDQQEPPAAAPSTVVAGEVPDKNNELASFWDRLSRHDWTHMMSDDPGVYRRGADAEGALKAEAKRLGPVGEVLYEAWHAHVWKGGERPDRPGDR